MKKKVLLFTDSLGAGGAQRQLVGLAELLKEKYNVKVCVYHDFPFYKSYLDERNIQNVLITSASSTFLRIPSFLKFVRNEKPDYVIAYQETPSVVASIAKIMWPKFKLIVSERNTTQSLTFRDRLRFNLYNHVDYIVSNSYAQSKFILKHYCHLEPKIKTIVNFVDMDFFYPHNHAPNNPMSFLVVSSIIPSKNTIGFIEAIKILVEKKQKSNFVVNWYGYLPDYPSDYLDKCKSLISKYKLGHYIVLHPKKSNIIEEYQKADVLCLPSFFEGTPNAICEGMACGLPIVCSNICDNGLLVKDGVNGYLFNPHEPESIANTIEQLLNLEKSILIDFSRESRSCAEKLFNKDVFIEKYESIISAN